MMKIFFGAAIQGAENRQERAETNEFIINTIKQLGHSVVTEHTTGKTYEEAIEKLEQAIGKLPPKGLERRIFVRNKMIEAIESPIDAVVFEVSVPSLGTGIEIAHAYLRPKMNLKAIPILALYQKDFWPNDLSTMIRGITTDQVPQFHLLEYTTMTDISRILKDFF